MKDKPTTGAKSGRVGVAQIAAALGVSPATISNAYNRPDQLSASLREKILATAAQLGYTGPDPAARSLRLGQTGAIGVLYTNHLSYAFSDPAAVQFLQGLARAAEEAGLGLLLIPAVPGQESNPQVIINAAVDGFIIFTVAHNEPLLTTALERHLPIVLVDQPHLADLPFVGLDETGAAYAAARHLIDLGHRRFGVISFRLGSQPYFGRADLKRQAQAAFELTRARLDGYKRALAEAELDWSDVPVYECRDSEPGDGRLAALELLTSPARPTAILALSDQLALGALEAARELKLSVPDDLSLVGFDDIEAARLTTPKLTTVHQPHVEKGLKAGRMLIAQLRGETAVPTEILPTHLVIRESTCPPAAI